MSKLKQQVNVIKNNLHKFRTSKYFKARFIYTKYYEKLEIDENSVLLQSYEGSSISGNVYYILKELYNNPEYRNLKLYVASSWGRAKYIDEYLKQKGYDNVKVVRIHSKEYCKILVSAKYLVNNATFAPYFMKRKGQIYLNTWHGTPLKAMGRNIKNAPNELGNTQRNLLMSDYLLYPNEFTFEHMREDYMLNNIFKGEYILSGYPRNEAFYDEESRNEIKTELGIEDKKVIVYMPTWRGSLNKKENNRQYHFIMYNLYELEKRLDENTIVYVKLHNYANSRIRYSAFKKIKNFPKKYETYELLNIADCLITDYSSVFFDYANTGKKIVLYAYDKEEYLNERGMYLDYDSLPFKIVTDIPNLVDEINCTDKYNDYTEFRNEFNKYDSKHAAKDICDYVFKNKKSPNMEIIKGEKYCNNKKNILIFGGNFAKNGITTALKGLINNVDKEKNNYYLAFYKKRVENNKETINDFDKIDYISIQGPKNMTILEAFYHFIFFRTRINNKAINKKMEKIYKREIQRIFPNIKFDYAIHYSGYERQIMNLFRYIDAKRIIYLHNDMKKEIQTKNNIHEKSFKKVLDSYDKIVGIRETTRNEIVDYYPKLDKNKIYIAHNFNNIETIREKAQKNVAFEKSTYCNISKN